LVHTPMFEILKNRLLTTLAKICDVSSCYSVLTCELYRK